MEGMANVNASPRRRPAWPWALAWLTVLLAAGAWAQPATAPATASDPESDLAPEAAACLERFMEAWEGEDHVALAGLLESDGAVVSLGRAARPESRTSPAQAHYVFKSLFQGTDDHVLRLESGSMHDDAATAVLEWRYRRGESRLRERLFISLSRDDGWRVDAVRAGS